MRSNKTRRPKPPMDGQTSTAFAREAFEQLHPVVPPWFWRYVASGGVKRLPPAQHRGPRRVRGIASVVSVTCRRAQTAAPWT